MSSEHNEQTPEAEYLKAPNGESRFSISAILVGVGSIFGLVVAGFLISFSKQSAKVDIQRKSIVEESTQASGRISSKKSPRKFSNKVLQIKPLVEPQPPAGRIARMKSLVLTHKRAFIMASVITALVIAGIAYYLFDKWQLEEEVNKKVEEAKRLEAALDKEHLEKKDLIEELRKSQLANKALNDEKDRQHWAKIASRNNMLRNG